MIIGNHINWFYKDKSVQTQGPYPLSPISDNPILPYFWK